MTSKRVNVTYGGVDYTLADADAEDLKATVLHAAVVDQPLWLRVNQGEGSYRETDLLITPGIPIAITAIDAE